MPKRRLLWHLFRSYVVLALTAMFAIGFLASHQFEETFLDTLRTDLKARAAALDKHVAANATSDPSSFDALCGELGRLSEVRAAVMLPGGKVLCDSQGRPEEMESQLARSEVQGAFDGQAHDTVRYNAGLDQGLLYLATPIVREGHVVAVIYLANSLAALDEGLFRVRLSIVLAGLAMVGLSGFLAWWIARGLSATLDELRLTAGRLANGQWNTRMVAAEQQELAEVTEAFNRMAEALERRINVLVQNNNEQQAVLASMAEGVLAVDGQERIISLNTASGRLLGLDQAHAQGRRLQEVVRNADLSRFITRALACRDSIESDILLHGDRERVMQAHGSALHDSQGQPIGAVIVLNDVTDFRRLEHIRRDFVANVSHELKTPVTSIKGFVETLLDGAMHDPVDTERFLHIVAKQADRLHAIIEDLLSLSKIEEHEDHDDIVADVVPLRPLLESAVHACASAAEMTTIDVRLDCDEPLKARVNGVLMEQAVTNLLDNAIKYSEPGRQVRIVAGEQNGEVTISVVDRGSGIAKEHLARIFERFYRVDPARSRKLGGTGLGLAIVKHIVQAHHGQVSVDSTLGVGSTFTIHLPKPH